MLPGLTTLFSELIGSRDLFETMLDGARLVVRRLEFRLQGSVTSFIRENEPNPLAVALVEGQDEGFERAYSADVADLTEMFYREWIIPSAIPEDVTAKSYIEWVKTLSNTEKPKLKGADPEQP